MEKYIGESEFRGALVAAYPSLLRYAESLSGSRAEAWDLVHETMERGLRYRAGFQHGDTPNGWLATILRRIFIDRCRQARTATNLCRRWGREEASGRAEDAEPEEAVAATPSWETFSVEDVRRALMFVSPTLRSPYTMLVFEHLSYSEIGRRLSLTPGTIASRVFRARQRLRQLLTSGEFCLRSLAAGQSERSASPTPVAATRRLREVRPRVHFATIDAPPPAAANG